MAQQTINLGSTANDGTGDPLRSGGEKINSNFTELYGRTQNLEDNQVTGVVQYSTLAELPTTGTLNVSYKVTNDPTSSNNGYYHWNGSSYVKDANLANGVIESGNVDAVSGETVFQNSIKTFYNNAFIEDDFSVSESIVVPFIKDVEITILDETFTDDVHILKFSTDASGNILDFNLKHIFQGFLIGVKTGVEFGCDVYEYSDYSNKVAVKIWVDTTNLPLSFTFVNSDLATNKLKLLRKFSGVRYNGVAEKIRSLDELITQEFLTFTEAGVYDSNGDVTLTYGGFHMEKLITEGGEYILEWDIEGGITNLFALDVSDNVLASWTGNDFDFVNNDRILVPQNTVKLKLSARGTNTSGYFTHVVTANAENYGVISEDRVEVIAQPLIDTSINKIVIPKATDEPPFIDIKGNAYTHNLWVNDTSEDTVSRVYTVSDSEQYDLFYLTPFLDYEMFFTTLEINEQVTNGTNIQGITYNGTVFNNLEADLDTVTVNGYTKTRRTITNFTPPSGAKRMVLIIKFVTPLDNVRIFKRSGAKGSLIQNANANKKIVICGDSVASQTEAEKGKEILRDALGCQLDTFAMGGSGWSINATPTWVTPNNISGVYQVEELVKPESETYDIYLLSGTLNDPLTHNKPIGDKDYCKPYLKILDDPDLTDPNLDTVLGALNFSIQRIYEKNPSAKILISTPNKYFLDAPASNGLGVESGFNPYDTTTNSSGSTYFEYVEALRSLGDIWGIEIVDIYGKAGLNEFNKSETMADTLHPSERGYEGIWGLWFEAILKA